ncbi:MAG: ATP-binding protein, partial [Bacteroidetes bacterium]
MLQRNKYQELLAHASKPEHTILIGARQTGKSTLLKQLGEALSGSGERVALLNLERKNILSELNQSPENVFK